jgi:OmpA-OmpF porin, OOP family
MRRLAGLTVLTAVATLALSAGSPASADAQSWGDKLKKKAEEAAKKKAEERTEKRAGEAADKALDKAECAATDKACQEKKAAAAKEGAAGGAVVPAGAAGGAASVKPGEGAWVNYDFKPGDRIVFADDFTKDEVGNFPRRLEFISGNMEVAEWQGGRYLRATHASEFAIPLGQTLPERFTLEMDVYHGGREWGWDKFELRFAEGAKHYVWAKWTAGGLYGGGMDARTDLGREKFKDRFVPVRVMGDGSYIKVYMGDNRVANVPNAAIGRANKIWVTVGAHDKEPAFIGAIRVAAGGKKLYDALAEKGRVATQGIYFDTGSDGIRPESTPTLKEIGQMLTEHPDLKLTIEGHTDNVGNAAANQDLSQRRAAAVQAYLVAKHGVDSSRLNNAGFGDKKPAAPNTTPEGRQQNRRVELVKM